VKRNFESDVATIEGLAAHLDALSADLSQDERQELVRIIVAAMNPLDRMGHLDPAAVLDSAERAELRALETWPKAE
jgi:hypothetical protein